MDDITTETAFLNEVSAFLSSTDISRTNVELANVSLVHQREPQTSDIDNIPDARNMAASNKRASKHLTRREKEVLRKKRYEQRLKNERETLHVMAIELTTKLAQLKQSRKNKQHTTIIAVDLNSPWRALALLRREERRRAEEEQVRLKDAVDDQAIYLATLRALVPKHLYDWIAITETTRAAIVSSHQVNMQANHVLFAEHLRQVFSAYTQLGTVFGGIDLTTMPDGMTTSGRSPRADEALGYFRHFNKCTLPFSFKQTHEAWWNLTNLNQWLQDGDGYANLADPNDTVILRLHLVRTLPTGITVSIKQRYILRRFVEETRAVFMWKTYSEGEGPFAGIFVEGTGWARLQPSTDGSTIVGVCVDQAPMQLNASKIRTTEAEQFYALMQSLLKENAEVFTHALSKKLMEETLFD